MSTQLNPTKPRVPKWLRVLLPAMLILVWFAGAGIGGPYFGKVSEVSSNDQTAYLPASAEATQVQQRLSDFRDSKAIPAVVVFTSEQQLTKSELSSLGDAVSALPEEIAGVSDELSPLLPSDDGKAAQAFVPISDTENVKSTVADLGAQLRDAAPQGVTAPERGRFFSRARPRRLPEGRQMRWSPARRHQSPPCHAPRAQLR